MLGLFFALLTFISTLSGGWAAIRFRDRLHLVLGFASGAVIATALFEILPEVISEAQKMLLPLNNLLFFSAVGFLFFHSLERIIVFRSGNHSEEGGNRHVGTLSATGFSVHSFFDGLGIGLGFLTSIQLGLVISLAVLAHDFSDGLNTATVILKNQGKKSQAWRWLLIDALAPLLGLAVSFYFNGLTAILPYILAFYFGFFLYLGAADLLPEAHHRHSSYLTLFTTVLGFAAVFIISALLRGL